MIDNFEVVYVTGKGRLIDAESYEHTIRAPDGSPLAAGFYAVRRSVVARLEATCDEDATFRGPFQRRDEAWAAIEQLREQEHVRRLDAMPGALSQTIASDVARVASLEPPHRAGRHAPRDRP